ncbi:hypothetical protein D9M72_575160 [compost metagenome]
MVHRAHQQRVAVRLVLGDIVSADGGAGAGTVLDDHRLAEALGELVAQRACEYVGGAARRERHDQGDGLGRPGLRHGSTAEGNSGGGQGQCRYAAQKVGCTHVLSPV